MDHLFFILFYFHDGGRHWNAERVTRVKMRAGRIPPDSAHRYPTPRSVLLFGMTLPNSVLFIARMHHVDMGAIIAPSHFYLP